MMSNFIKLSLVISFFTISMSAYAEQIANPTDLSNTQVSTPASSTDAKNSELLKNKQFEENEKITDAKLKADSGSLSKYSLSFSLSYYGPPVGDLSVKDQPNPDGTISSNETAISGSFGGRYRIDKTDTVKVGSGLKLIHPFHGAERTDLNNPYISYSITTKLSTIQMRNSFGTSIITVPNYTAVGEFASLDYDNSLVYDIGQSGFAIGFDTAFGLYLYNREYRTTDGKSSTYSLSFYPNVKYNINDKFNINTSLSISYLNSRSNLSRWNLQNKILSQRLGLGYSYSRDVYIAPYLNFYPDNLNDKSTTFNISTSFSIL